MFGVWVSGLGLQRGLGFFGVQGLGLRVEGALGA